MTDLKPISEISPREMQIIEMAAGGLIDKEIARRLTLSMATIRTHWVRIRSKLGAVNRAEVIARVMHHQMQNDMKSEASSGNVRSRSALCEAALDHHPEGLVIADVEGTILYVNRSAASLLGHDVGQLEGAKLDGWVQLPAGGVSKLFTAVRESGDELTVVGTLGNAGHRASLTLRPSTHDGVVNCAIRSHTDSALHPTERTLPNHRFELR